MPDIVAWWFENSDEIAAGETLTDDSSEPSYWSKDPFDTLQYASGTILYKASVNDHPEAAAIKRTVLDRRDAVKMLHLFARKQALSIVHLWEASFIVHEFLQTGNKRAQARTIAEAATVWGTSKIAILAARSAMAAADSNAVEAAIEAVSDTEAARQMFNKMVKVFFEGAL